MKGEIAMMFDNKVYDILNKIQRWLPALGVLYLALCQIWNLPYGQQINNTIVAIATFLAATLEISTGVYHKDVSTQIITSMVGDEFPSEEADETEQAE